MEEFFYYYDRILRGNKTSLYNHHNNLFCKAGAVIDFVSEGAQEKRS